jgi:hypothetical protein
LERVFGIDADQEVGIETVMDAIILEAASEQGLA